MAVDVAQALGGKNRGRGFRCRCPAHDDREPSLDVDDGEKGVVLKCRAGCSQKDVLAAVAKIMGRPLFDAGEGLPRPNGEARSSASPKSARTTYDYRDPASGEVRYRKDRFDRADGTKFCAFKTNPAKGYFNSNPHLLYGAERLADIGEGAPIWIVEGEKKVDRLAELGAVAVSGDCGSDSIWTQAHAESLRGLAVILWPDSDAPGENYIARAAAAIRAADPGADIRVVRPFAVDGADGKPFPDGSKRDVCDWDGDLAELAEGAVPYAPLPNGKEDSLPAEAREDPIYAYGEAPSLPAPPAPLVRIINPADWEGLPVPDRKWIVPGYIPHMTVTMLSGDGGQGKSLLALQLAAAMALAKDWLGLLPEPGKTLVLSAEDDGDEMHRRLDRIRKLHGASWADLADVRLIDLAGENSVLGALMNGQILPTEMFRTLDAFMAEWKPSLTTLDVLADMFGGDEVKRAQVRQFINLLKGLARKHRSAILLLAHPSLTGMNSGTGLSGSTDWNNGVRSRLYFQTPKTDSGDALNKNLRTLEGIKANYGERGGKIDLEWKNGLFVPVHIPSGFDKLAAEQNAEDVFMTLLKRFNAQGRNAIHTPGVSYAPKLFAEEPEGQGISKAQFTAAMRRLFKNNKIQIVDNGRPSKPSRTLMPLEELSLDDEGK